MSGVACAFGGANVSSANVINASAVVPTSPRTAVNVIVFLCRIVILQFARAFGRKHISADYPIIATGGTRQYRKKGTLRSLNHHRERNKIIKKIKLGRTAMRIIILAGIIALILGAVSYFSLNARQTPTGSAYTARRPASRGGFRDGYSSISTGRPASRVSARTHSRYQYAAIYGPIACRDVRPAVDCLWAPRI